MAGPHADSEVLALMAMGSPVPPEVAAHVASCAECSKDISLLTSLLDAEGPDSGEGGATTEQHDSDEPPASLDEAMADGNDARQAQGSSGYSNEPAPTQEVAPAEAGPTSGINATALVVALLIFVGAALLAFFALR